MARPIYRKLGNKSVPKLLDKVDRIDIVDDKTAGGTGVPASAESVKSVYQDVQAEISARVQQGIDLKGGASVGYNTLKKIEDIVVANKSELEGDIAGINAVATDAIAAEASARASADSILQGNISQEVSERATAISNEASSRQTADGVLQANIDAEVSARTSAINNEVSARQVAVAGVQSNLDAEVAERTASVDTLTTSISNEVTARQNADSSLDARISNVESGMVAGVILKGEVNTLDDFNSMVEADVVEGWAYKVKSGTTGTNDVYVCIDGATPSDNTFVPTGWVSKSFLWLMDYADVSSAVQVEKSRALAKEAELQANIDLNTSTIATNKTLAENARTALQTNLEAADLAITNALNQEIADRQTAVSNEASLRTSADNAIQASLDDEISNRISAVSNEASARQSADDILTTAIATEATNRASAILAEETARISADNALDARLDIVESDELTAGSIAYALRMAKTYANLWIPVPFSEGIQTPLIIANDSVTLAYNPYGGIKGIMPRQEIVVYLANGETAIYNISTVTGNIATIGVETAGELDGLQATISYFYTEGDNLGSGAGEAGSGAYGL